MKCKCVSVFVRLSEVPSAVTLTSGSAAADSKWTAHPASTQLPKKHFYTHSQEEPDVYTPTQPGTYRHTDTYTLHWGLSRRCVLCNGRVKWSQTPQTSATGRTANWECMWVWKTGRERWVTLLMRSEWSERDYGVAYIFLSLCWPWIKVT